MFGLRGWGPQANLTRTSFPRRQYYFTANGFRPRSSAPRLQREVRAKTTQAGEDKSGHINAGPNEEIFFLDSMSFTTIITSSG